MYVGCSGFKKKFEFGLRFQNNGRENDQRFQKMGAKMGEYIMLTLTLLFMGLVVLLGSGCEWRVCVGCSV